MRRGAAARREELELRDRLEQRRDVGERPGEVLEVVDHREHARASGERPGKRLDRLLALLLVDAEARRDRRDDEVRLGDGGEVDEGPPPTAALAASARLSSRSRPGPVSVTSRVSGRPGAR